MHSRRFAKFEGARITRQRRGVRLPSGAFSRYARMESFERVCHDAHHFMFLLLFPRITWTNNSVGKVG